MAYQQDQNGDIVINGFRNGIGDDPFQGLTDMRNMNIVSVPGEADINFKTQIITNGAISGSITSFSGSTATFTGGTGIENYVAIYFTSVDSYTGFSTATPYWVGNLSGSTFKIYSDYGQTTAITPGGSGTATFKAYQIGVYPDFVTSVGGTVGGGIQHFAQPTNINFNAGLTSYYTFGVDLCGMVWGNKYTTGTNSYWTYTGNSIVNNSSINNAGGNGLVYWRVNNGDTGASLTVVDYLFVFRNSQIDFMPVQGTGSGLPTVDVWTNGWNPSTGTTGNTNYLTVPTGTFGSHYTIVHPDGRVYACDGNNILKWYQTSATSLFSPTNTATYTYTRFNLLPIQDLAQCLSPFGTGMLIGGQGNFAYNWDTTSNLVSGYIYVAEQFIARIVTVNVNAYLFAGNRGRIYITNGSQANLWKKIPDHLTNTIEPKFQWGGATSSKNQLYFSFKATNNSGSSTLTVTGGLWAIDLDNGALRLTNQYSYGSYAGFASALIEQVYNPVVSSLPKGAGIISGWYDGSSTCGVDIPSTSSAIYSSGEAYLISENIPIGTLLKPTTLSQVEFKLSSPLLSGESMELQVASNFTSNTNPTFVSALTVTGDGTVLSGNSQKFPVQKNQWIMVKAISTGTTGTPSFNRLTELRLVGTKNG